MSQNRNSQEVIYTHFDMTNETECDAFFIAIDNDMMIKDDSEEI